MTARSSSQWLTDILLQHAVGKLGGRCGEWAEAMVCEASSIASDTERLRWAAGCAVASYRAPGGLDWVIYPGGLIGGVAVMTAYQWSADESLVTVGLIGLLAFALGCLWPSRLLVSGLAIGLVVAAVNAFEAISGISPAYETHARTLEHSAHWIVLVAPALSFAAIGGLVGSWLKKHPIHRDISA